MQYISSYDSQLGNIMITANDECITGLFFKNSKDYGKLTGEPEEKETSLIKDAKHWLDIYFTGKDPRISLPLYQEGTGFQQRVWEILKEIPYGCTISYGQIAKQLAAERGIPKMAAQAVGGAVGRNRILLMIPCHRVIGTNGSLTGFGGGLERKAALLALERIALS